MECEGSAQSVDAGANLININSVTAEDVSEENEIQREICKLWDLDSLGIKKIDEVHEAFIDSIMFDGERYSVRLPWKKGHGDLPSNYENSLSRMKGQTRKSQLSATLLVQLQVCLIRWELLARCR